MPDLESLALQYFRRRSAAFSMADATDPVHILNPAEIDALRRIERGVVFRAGLAGALSAIISAGVEVWGGLYGLTTAQLAVWVVAATIVATVFEVGFLYWDSLRSVHDLARAAGVELFTSAGHANALARAALELPNRPDPQLGVDPYREASKAALLAAALLYKLKIGLTNFLLKLLLRRLAGRTVLRSFAPFVAVPVTAFWNAWVARAVIREARIRAMGPSAARARLDGLLAKRTLPEAGRLAVLRAIGYAVVGKRDLHPNLAAFLLLARERFGAFPSVEPLDDRAAFLNQLPQLPDDERAIALEFLSFALICDGRLSARERRLWNEARAACALPPDHGRLGHLRRAFVAGEVLET